MARSGFSNHLLETSERKEINSSMLYLSNFFLAVKTFLAMELILEIFGKASRSNDDKYVVLSPVIFPKNNSYFTEKTISYTIFT